jgi:hypothetical protein
MRIALVFVVLLLAACEGSFIQVSDSWRKVKIDKSYQARDNCLARNATADGAGSEDAATLAHAIALACASETERLVEASTSNGGDAKVALAIRQDSEFRAMGFVLKARGQPIF